MESALKQKLSDDLKQALRGKDRCRISVIRLVMSAIHNTEIANGVTFIDGMGYIGAMIIGVLVPFLIDVTGGWIAVFYLWAVISLVIVCLVIFVYFKTPQWRQARWLK